jgi:hypothetical protein
LSKHFVGFLENLRHQKDILKLTDLWARTREVLLSNYQILYQTKRDYKDKAIEQKFFRTIFLSVGMNNF